MNTGQAPSLMIDLASSHIRDRRRSARERAQEGAALRNPIGKRFSRKDR